MSKAKASVHLSGLSFSGLLNSSICFVQCGKPSFSVSKATRGERKGKIMQRRKDFLPSFLAFRCSPPSLAMKHLASKPISPPRCRLSVGEIAVICWWYVGEVTTDYRPIVIRDRLSATYRPTFDRYSTDVGSLLDGQSTDMSTESRPTNRSTPLHVTHYRC